VKYCRKCSSILSDDDRSCANCGAPVNEEAEASPDPGNRSASPSARGSPSAEPSVQDYEAVPPKYLPWSIVLLVLSVICCFLTGLPGSIVALVYGSKVDSLMSQGKKREAWQASKTAKYWLIVSTAVTGGLVILGTIGFIALVMIEAMKD
jgi:hypothetical protein